MLKVSKFALFYVLSSNAGRFNLIYSDNNAVFIPSFNIEESKEYEVKENFVLLDSVNSNDDNLVNILVLTTRLKNNEATESLVFLKLFKTHSLSYAERNIGSNGFKAHTEYCQNIKTAVRSVVEETKILPHIDEFLV